MQPMKQGELPAPSPLPQKGRRVKTKWMAFMALMAALLCVVAPFTLPVGAVPFSMAIWIVFLTGALLPPVPALGSVAVYLLLGAVGLPVFSGLQGGIQVLVGPTGGFIWGYFFVAGLVALGRKWKAPAQFAIGFAGLVACYLLGTLWFMAATQSSFLASLLICVAPFVFFDLLKEAAALLLARVLMKRLPMSYYL